MPFELENGLEIQDLVNGQTEHLEEYIDIYKTLFPQYVRYIPIMRKRASLSFNSMDIERWHQWLLRLNRQAVGIAGFLYNRRRNIGLLMDLAIKPEARSFVASNGERFARHVLDLAIQQLKLDALEDGMNGPLCMAAEVEHRALLEQYTRYGYVKYPVEYFEPPGTPELANITQEPDDLKKIGFGQMYVGAFPVPGNEVHVDSPKVVKEVLNAFLIDHYRLSSDHWLIQKLIAGNSEKESRDE